MCTHIYKCGLSEGYDSSLTLNREMGSGKGRIYWMKPFGIFYPQTTEVSVWGWVQNTGIAKLVQFWHCASLRTVNYETQICNCQQPLLA